MSWIPSSVAVLVTWIAVATSVDPGLMHCIVKRESDYRIEAVSSAGAIGVAQFMPETHAWLAEKAKDELGFEPVLGNPVHDLLLLSWAIRNGFGDHWSTWSACFEGK